jgi:hypothetical protein
VETNKKNAKFTTKSVYEFLERDLSGADNKMIWKVKILLEIQIFMWQVFRDAIPTRHSMRKRKWQGNPLCSFVNRWRSWSTFSSLVMLPRQPGG